MPKLKTCGNNDKCDECLEDQLPVWDESIPQGQMCQRPDGYARENLDTCGNEAQVGIPYGHYDEETIENDDFDTFSSVGFHYYCEECAAEFKAEDDICAKAAVLIEKGELEEAATVLSRLIDPKGGEK